MKGVTLNVLKQFVATFVHLASNVSPVVRNFVRHWLRSPCILLLASREGPQKYVSLYPPLSL